MQGATAHFDCDNPSMLRARGSEIHVCVKILPLQCNRTFRVTRLPKVTFTATLGILGRGHL